MPAREGGHRRDQSIVGLFDNVTHIAEARLRRAKHDPLGMDAHPALTGRALIPSLGTATPSSSAERRATAGKPETVV